MISSLPLLSHEMTWPRSKESLLVGITLLLQVSLISQIPIPYFRPDLSLVPLTLLALYRGGQGTMVVAFLVGLILDCISLGTLGFHAFSKSLIVCILGILGQRIIPENRLAQLLALLFAVLLQFALHIGLRFLLLGHSLIRYPEVVFQLLTEVLTLFLIFLGTRRYILKLLLPGERSGGSDAHSGIWLEPRSR